MLATFAGAVLLLWPAPATSHRSVPEPVPSGFPVQSFDFSYASHSYLNPALPGVPSQGEGLTIACESKGALHLALPAAGEPALVFEFTNVLCAGADVIQERGLSRTVHYTRNFLASAAAVGRATEDPALAIARSLFLQLDGGLRSSWPQKKPWLQHERRLEGDVTVTVDWNQDQKIVHWSKKFSGPVHGEPTAAGLTQTLQYQVVASSEEAQPIEFGLLRLEGHEQSVSLQNKNLVARTDIEIRIQRRAPASIAHVKSLLAGQANAPAAAPKMLSTRERERIVQRWRRFKDGEGQAPARGSTESNQEEYLELKQALRQDPSLGVELAEDLEDIDPASSAFATLSGALIYSGEAQALDAFVAQALAHKDDVAWQERALPMVGLAPGPTLQSWKYLDTMRQQSKDPELSTAAELGMATHLKHGYQDPAFVDELQARLTAAHSEMERLHLLDLVGNAGLEQFFPIVASWLPGASLKLRLRIVQALRFMQRPEAEKLLLLLAADPHMDLALMALQCLRDRVVATDSIPVLLQLLRSAPDDRIRLKVLENLYEARHRDAHLLKKIRDIREALVVSPQLAEAWDQMEKDWVDPGET
ncbi:HEAT repeat domain-containing protein [Oligoflexus tunisiensis]|uniref:HEAT repeat domain-containing protein n=1 Tax=Oligoflexus tunisiensis TaxID=708132 RepID=UPI001C404BEE|nr:HEAT repeat domain-containing protein [Oligoflexus tunisiensis]